MFFNSSKKLLSFLRYLNVRSGFFGQEAQLLDKKVKIVK